MKRKMNILGCLTVLLILLQSNIWFTEAISNVANLREHLQHFSSNRSHFHPQGKEKARTYIINFFKQFGNVVAEQNSFQSDWIDVNSNPIMGMNYVHIIRGENWQKSSDRPILLGTHYDGFNNTGAVDDNGSGMAALLEVSKALAQDGRRRKHSVILLAFDFEEYLFTGSQRFVDNYLMSEIFTKNNIAPENFQGAIILDTMMNYNSTNHSQVFPNGLDTFYPYQYDLIEKRGFRGDFMLFVGRTNNDRELLNLMSRSWGDNSRYYNVSLPITFNGRPTDWPPLAQKGFGDLLRSDHRSFWLSKILPQGLPAVWLTDTANFRGYMVQCYHKPCDTLERAQTTDNLNFLLKTTNALYVAINTAAEASVSSARINFADKVVMIVMVVTTYATSLTGKLFHD